MANVIGARGLVSKSLPEFKSRFGEQENIILNGITASEHLKRSCGPSEKALKPSGIDANEPCLFEFDEERVVNGEIVGWKDS